MLAGCEAGDSGGASQAGGATATGGQQSSSGGATGSGGAARSGGTSGSGGVPGSGGASAKGGATSTGGSSANGGGMGSGGATSSGGSEATGGTIASGGATSSGGTAASGGVTGGGGQSGLRDASAAGGSGPDALMSVDAEPACTPTDNCTEENKSVTKGTGKHCCYTYENWVGSGNATLTLKSDGFSVNWTGSTQFVGRKGIRPGSGDIVTQYNANFSPSGNGYLCLYGWTTEPLVEYYVLESWGSYKPPGGSPLGTVNSDGGTYDIYKSMRNNEPSIIGTATFPQYWSVRQQKRTSGTITLSNHIAAWASKGMPMGDFYEVSMTVEGYQSSGNADVKFSMK